MSAASLFMPVSFVAWSILSIVLPEVTINAPMVLLGLVLLVLGLDCSAPGLLLLVEDAAPCWALVGESNKRAAVSGTPEVVLEVLAMLVGRVGASLEVCRRPC